VPRDLEDVALRLAEEKLGKENLTRRDLLAGRTLREVFDQYGVL
jgi:4-hydroxy-4-methyl-2-oxoglutarate aldolase